MKSILLSDNEEELLFRALEYFKRAEETEIEELRSPGGNPSYIPDCEKRLDIFRSLILKAHNHKNFGPLTREEEHFFYRALNYFRKAEKRDIADLSTKSGNKEELSASKNRLVVYELLIRKFGLSEESLTL